MNYARIYDQLMNRAKTRVLLGYSEKHHILPRSLGGSDSKDNLVKLTAQEHLLAHMLLVRMHKGTRAYYSMVQALFFMCSEGTFTQAKIKSSRQYANLRTELAKIVSDRNKKRTAEGTNPFAGERGSLLAKQRAAKALKEGRSISDFVSPAEKSRNVKAYWASLTAQERREVAQRNADRRPPEKRADIAARSAAARRANDEKLILNRQQRMVRINLIR